MRKRIIRIPGRDFVAIAVLAALATLACGAGHTLTMGSVVRTLDSDGIDAAVEEFRESFGDSTGRNRLLYLMELGNLYRLAGDYPTAVRLFLEADRLSDLQGAFKPGRRIASLLTSDLALEFRDADYEKVMINYCLAVCYAAMGDVENALVECRRLNNKLKVMNAAYGDMGNRYSDDAFVRYFSGVLYEKAGELNDALVAYRRSVYVYDEFYSRYYGLPAPDMVKIDVLRLCRELGFRSMLEEYSASWPDLEPDSLYRDPGWGEIVVVAEVGFIPPRKEISRTAVVNDRIYRIALPSIPEVRRMPHSLEAWSGDFTVRGFLAEDLTAIARKNLEDQAGRILAKAVARLVLKAGVAEAGEELVEKLTGEEGIASGMAGFLLSLAGAFTERADLRSWLTLPDRIYMARLTLPPGRRRVTVTMDGKTIHSGTVDVKPGDILLLFPRGG